MDVLLLRDIRIHHEYSFVAKQRLGGFYLLPDAADILVLHGVMFPRQALYGGGVFKFRINLPADYPSSPPTVTFITPVFHPFVDAAVRRAAR
jgi:ubiquitin-protein ligase